MALMREVDPSKISANLDSYRQLISYWRYYPDRFVDYVASLNPRNSFRLHFTQRVLLRLFFRYKNVFATFSRGFSKSFIAVLALILKCVLYPGARIATVADGKEQSALILGSKIEEIMALLPALSPEIMWDTRGKVANTSRTKDSVQYSFRNGSNLLNVPNNEKTRGQRFHSLLIEEVAKVDQDNLTQIIMPTLTVSRRVSGHAYSDPDEILNQSCIFVTSAGYKMSYAYEKLIATVCRMAADYNDEDAFIIGGDWKIPVVEGLQPADFIYSQEIDPSTDPEGFNREFKSLWSGASKGAFFSPVSFDRCRTLNNYENAYNPNLPSKGFYVLGVDVGRLGDLTETVVIKVIPTITGPYRKQVVNIYTMENEHFKSQAIHIKNIFAAFKCTMCVVDGNGIGAGLVDYLVTEQVDPDTDKVLPSWGVANDEDGTYKWFETADTVRSALWVMKANQVINSELYSYCQAQINNQNIQFLVDESVMRPVIDAKRISSVQRADQLRPYVETSILKSELMNLVKQNPDGANVILRRLTQTIHKDKVSALIYGLSYVRLMEQRGKDRRMRDFSRLLMYN